MSQPPYPGPPHPEQPSGQPYQQPGPGGPPGYPAAPYQGQPNPDVPTSVPPGYPPQPAYGQPGHTQVDYGQPGYPQPGAHPGYQQPEYQQPGAQPGYPPPGYEQSGAQPGYQQPGAQPGYQQPGYQQAGYQQPGYPQSGPPMPGGYPPPPAPKSRAVPITLVSIAVFLVLCVGGGTAVYLAGRNAADDGTTARPTAAAPTTRATTTPPGAVITVVEPRTLGGRPKLTDPQFAGAADQLKRGLAKVPGASRTVSGLYGAPAEQNIVIAAAAAAEVTDPRRELDGIFLGVGVGGLEITGLTAAPTGSLGGYAKCGRGEAGGAPLIMCGWADEGSVGWLLWYYKSMSAAKAELPTLRGQIEKKSN